MRKIASTLVLMLFACFALQAQEEDTASKDLLLATLNSVAHLKFENEQVSQLMEYNTGFVDQVYEILDSEKEDKHKKELLDALSNTREVELHGFLSKHETKKYLKYMED